MKWNVHYGVYLTVDEEIETETLEEAYEIMDERVAKMSYDDYEYGDDYYDGWEI